MSEFDGFDRIFEEMVRLTESLLNSQGPSPAPAAEVTPPEKEERDELIDRQDSFNYILNAPGFEERQLHVSVHEDEIEVKTPDFEVRKPLPTRVEPSTAETKYRNGVLSVRVKKKQ